MTHAELAQRLRAHCDAPPRSVLYDEAQALLLDVASGLTLPLPLGTVSALESRTDATRSRPYLALALDDGKSIALTDMGIAFAPVFTNTGPLETLPAVVCWRDFHTLLSQLKHELYGHGDAELGPGTVRLLMSCIAIVDGARAAGFDVSASERELEWHLKSLEARAPK